MIRRAIGGAALLVFSCLLLGPPAAAEQGQEAYVVPGHYIVMFTEDIDNPAALAEEMARQYGIELDHVYVQVFGGFSAACDPSTLTALENDPRIQHIEKDRLSFPIDPPASAFIIEMPEIVIPEPQLPEVSGGRDSEVILDLFRIVTPEDDPVRCIGAGAWVRCESDFFELPAGPLPSLIGIRFSDNGVEGQGNISPFFMWGYSDSRGDLFPTQKSETLSPIEMLTQKCN